MPFDPRFYRFYHGSTQRGGLSYRRTRIIGQRERRRRMRLQDAWRKDGRMSGTRGLSVRFATYQRAAAAIGVQLFAEPKMRKVKHFAYSPIAAGDYAPGDTVPATPVFIGVDLAVPRDAEVVNAAIAPLLDEHPRCDQCGGQTRRMHRVQVVSRPTSGVSKVKALRTLCANCQPCRRVDLDLTELL